MEACKRNHSGLWKGLMVGSFLGAAASFVFAPKSGEELRSDIKGRTDKVAEETKRLCSEGRTSFRNALALIGGRRERISASHIESPEEIVAEA